MCANEKAKREEKRKGKERQDWIRKEKNSKEGKKDPGVSDIQWV